MEIVLELFKLHTHAVRTKTASSRDKNETCEISFHPSILNQIRAVWVFFIIACKMLFEIFDVVITETRIVASAEYNESESRRVGNMTCICHLYVTHFELSAINWTQFTHRLSVFIIFLLSITWHMHIFQCGLVDGKVWKWLESLLNH